VKPYSQWTPGGSRPNWRPASARSLPKDDGGATGRRLSVMRRKRSVACAVPGRALRQLCPSLGTSSPPGIRAKRPGNHQRSQQPAGCRAWVLNRTVALDGHRGRQLRSTAMRPIGGLEQTLIDHQWLRLSTHAGSAARIGAGGERTLLVQSRRGAAGSWDPVWGKQTTIQPIAFTGQRPKALFFGERGQHAALVR